MHARRGSPFLLLLLLSGCVSFSSLTSPRTLEKGTSEEAVALGVTALHLDPGEGGRKIEDGPNSGFPDLMVRQRSYLAEGIDLGISVRPFALTLGADVRLQMIRSATTKSGIDLSLDPGVWANLSRAGATLPLLMGINWNDTSLILAPKLIYDHRMASGADVLRVGGSVGLMIPLSSKVGLMPEFSVAYPWLKPRDELRSIGYQAAIGFFFRSGE